MAHTFQTARANEYLALLGERLPDKILNHSVSVAEFMRSFAGGAGIADAQATTAGLLHDLCKAMQGEELLAGAQAYGLELTPLQREKPALLHGPVAAEECRAILGIDDEEVLEAIRWHTTGRPNWGRVGLALYVADFAEPLRTIPEAAEARALLREKGFDAVVRFVADRKLGFVRERFTPDPMSEAFAEWLGRRETR